MCRWGPWWHCGKLGSEMMGAQAIWTESGYNQKPPGWQGPGPPRWAWCDGSWRRHGEELLWWWSNWGSSPWWSDPPEYEASGSCTKKNKTDRQLIKLCSKHHINDWEDAFVLDYQTNFHILVKNHTHSIDDASLVWIAFVNFFLRN